MFGKNNFETKQFEKGDVLFREKEKVDSLFIIKSGEIACVTLCNDRLVPVGFFSGSGILAEDAIFSEHSKSSYSAIAMTNTTLVLIPKDEIHEIVDGSSSWIKRIMFDMSEKINRTTNVLADHRIVDEKFNGGKPFTSQEESLIIKALKEVD